MRMLRMSIVVCLLSQSLLGAEKPESGFVSTNSRLAKVIPITPELVGLVGTDRLGVTWDLTGPSSQRTSGIRLGEACLVIGESCIKVDLPRMLRKIASGSEKYSDSFLLQFARFVFAVRFPREVREWSVAEFEDEPGLGIDMSRAGILNRIRMSNPFADEPYLGCDLIREHTQIGHGEKSSSRVASPSEHVVGPAQEAGASGIAA